MTPVLVACLLVGLAIIGVALFALRPLPPESQQGLRVVRFRRVATLKADIEDMEETCSLDVADRGDHTLDETGQLLELSRERARQIENTAFQRLEKRRDQGDALLRTLREAIR